MFIRLIATDLSRQRELEVDPKAKIKTTQLLLMNACLS